MAIGSSQGKKQASISAFFAKSSQPDRPSQPQSQPQSPTKPVATAPPARSKADTKSAASEKAAQPGQTSRKRTPLTDQSANRRAVRSRTIVDDDSDAEVDGVDDADGILPRLKRARVVSPEPAEGDGSAGDESDADVRPARSKRTQNTTEPDPPADTAASRTSQFLFSSSPAVQDSGSEAERTRKKALHQKFVSKLGRPDSLLELRRNRYNRDGGAADGEAGDDQDQDQDDPDCDVEIRPVKKSAAKKGGKAKLTPLEQQVVDIKLAHPDTVLVVEVGYKFRFFGADAQAASRELGIMCIPGRMRFDNDPSEAHLDKFASASIPTHRLHVHVKRLVRAGLKVGVVRQRETAALKAAGDNKSGPFVRELTNVYTKATYVDDVDGLGLGTDTAGDDAGPDGSLADLATTATGYIVCLTESLGGGTGADEKVKIGLVAVQPATGDVVYDSFGDGFLRAELETRLLHLSPSEFVVVGPLSGPTDRVLAAWTGGRSETGGRGGIVDPARIERVEKTKATAADAASRVAALYSARLASAPDSSSDSSAAIANLPDDAAVCLSALMTHLAEFGLEHVFGLTSSFVPFSSRLHMLLSANTVDSLEVYRNQTDHTTRGSLLWCLDRTRTRFGRRLLRKWVGRPLVDRARLTERLDAVAELAAALTGTGPGGSAAAQLQRTVGLVRCDLERALLRLHYRKSSRPEIYALLETVRAVGAEYHGFTAKHVTDPASGFASPLLRRIVTSFIGVADHMLRFLGQVNVPAAKRDDKYGFFQKHAETDEMRTHQAGIAAVEAELDEYRSVAAGLVGKKNVLYTTVAGIDYLIELENTLIAGKKGLKIPPASWIKVSGTKKVSRFHSPDVLAFIRRRDEHRESLARACDDAFADFIADVGRNHFDSLRRIVDSIAEADCLLSLAECAGQDGYVRPEFPAKDGRTNSDWSRIDIEGARHPMAERMMLDRYVPNDVCLSNRAEDVENDPDPSVLLITGPNMGGKSSFVRATALVCLMAQIGAFVPATSARLPVLDGIYTRMGASDDLVRGESTFMVELGETSEILARVGTGDDGGDGGTPTTTGRPSRNLVILDELGRGTSTHDGYAIAEAVLHALIQARPFVLFVTHYQALGRIEATARGRVRNVHMAFAEAGGASSLDDEAVVTTDGRDDQALTKPAGQPEIPTLTFLYQVAPGLAHRSYGLNVARLANLPGSVIRTAATMSSRLESSLERRRLQFVVDALEQVCLDDGDGAEQDRDVDPTKVVETFVAAASELPLY